MAMVNTYTRMGISIRGIGRMENSMEKANIYSLMGESKREYGMKARESSINNIELSIYIYTIIYIYNDIN